MLLVDMYVFGDTVGTPAFQNATIDVIYRLCNWALKPSAHVITVAYANTVDGSGLRELFVDAYIAGIGFAVEIGKKSFHEDAESYPPKFVAALFCAHCLRSNGRPSPFDKKVFDYMECVYHTHPGGIKCGNRESTPKSFKIFV